MSFVLAQSNKNNAIVNNNALTSNSKLYSNQSKAPTKGLNGSARGVKSRRSNSDVERLHDSNVIRFDFLKIPILQPKLKINHPGDVNEKEADRVAERVVRMPISGPLAVKPTSNEKGIDVRCFACETTNGGKEDEKLDIDGKSSYSFDLETTNKIQNDVNIFRSGAGMQLDPAIRNFMEPRIGYNFSNVRIHADPNAAESARLMDARAFTVGSDIVFGEGQFSPHTSYGLQLLAHELTHVVQQSQGIGQGIQRQPGGAGQTVDAGQTIFTDIDSQLKMNTQGEEGARQIVTLGVGGDNRLEDLFIQIFNPEVKRQVDEDANGGGLGTTSKTVNYAQFLVRMRRYFDSWQALLDHFRDIRKLRNQDHFLHNTAAERFENVLNTLHMQSNASISVAFGLRHMYYGKLWTGTMMVHAMGYAIDIAARTNPALKSKDEGLEKTDTAAIAAIANPPGMRMDDEMKKSGLFKGVDNLNYIIKMGEKTATPPIPPNPKSASEDSAYKNYFDIFEREFQKMKNVSEHTLLSVSTPNRDRLIKLREEYSKEILLPLALNRQKLKAKNIPQTERDELTKEITYLEYKRIKYLREAVNYLDEWVAKIDEYIGKQQDILKKKGLILKKNGLDVLLREPTTINKDLIHINKKLALEQSSLAKASNDKARAIAESRSNTGTDIEKATERWDKSEQIMKMKNGAVLDAIKKETEARQELARQYSPHAESEVRKASLDKAKAMAERDAAREIAERDQVSWLKAKKEVAKPKLLLKDATRRETEARQELASLTSSRDELTNEYKQSMSKKEEIKKEPELLKTWENVRVLSEHRNWLVQPNLNTRDDVNAFERLIFGNLREVYVDESSKPNTIQQLKKAGLKNIPERLVDNPPIVRLATEGYFKEIPRDFDLKFFEEMVHWGFFPGAAYNGPTIDPMHFELAKGRQELEKYPKID